MDQRREDACILLLRVVQYIRGSTTDNTSRNHPQPTDSIDHELSIVHLLFESRSLEHLHWVEHQPNTSKGNKIQRLVGKYVRRKHLLKTREKYLVKNGNQDP